MKTFFAKGETLHLTVSVNSTKNPNVVIRHGENGPIISAEEVPILNVDKRTAWAEKHGGAAATELHGLMLPLAAEVVAILAEQDEPSTDPAPNTLEPWDEHIEGIDLLAEIESALRRFVVMHRPEHYTAAALWAVFAHAHDAFRFSPILIATSPEKGSGKTRLLEILSVLTPRPWFTTSPSDAVVFRKIDAVTPTFLLDEGDNVVWKERKELLSIFNGGYQRRSAFVSRCVGEGADLSFKDFSVWCPKALACLRVPLPDTTVSRSIVIHFKKKTRLEPIEELRDRTATAVFFPLLRKAARWSVDNLDALRQAEPKAPEGLSDRSADAWDPLLAIADLVGGEWPARVRAAALLLSGSSTDSDSIGVMLLEDILNLFADRGVDRLATAEILPELTSRDDRPWPEWTGGKALSSRGLAKLLKPFGIAPGAHRGEKVFKGYLKSDFEDAWSRYLPELSVTSVTSATHNDLAPKLSVTRKEDVTDKETPKCLFDNIVTVVTDKSGVGAAFERGDAYEEEPLDAA